MSSINDEKKCACGPSKLWPETKQCERKPVQYMFGDPYCQECFDKFVKIHGDMISKQNKNPR